MPEDVGAAWQACLAAKQRVSQLVSQPGLGSDGVRMLGAKFLDNTLLLMSAEAAANPKAPRAQHALLSAALVSPIFLHAFIVLHALHAAMVVCFPFTKKIKGTSPITQVLAPASCVYLTKP